MATLTTPAPQISTTAPRETACWKALRWIAGVVALGPLAYLIALLCAQHDFTPVEALVVLHFFPNSAPPYPEQRTLPDAQLEALRRNRRLALHVDSPQQCVHL